MASKKQVETSDVAQTVIPNDAPEPDRTATFTSPWGTRTTVSADLADVFKDAGYKPVK